MTYVGLFILIGSQFILCSVEAMATKTLFDVVAERVCNDDRLFAHGWNAYLADSLCKKYSQLYADLIRIHLHTLWQLFSERIDLRGHSRTVIVSGFLHDHIITGDAGGKLCVRSIEEPALFKCFTCHSLAILGLAVCPDEGVFCTGSRDKKVCLWTGNLLAGGQRADLKPPGLRNIQRKLPIWHLIIQELS